MLIASREIECGVVLRIEASRLDAATITSSETPLAPLIAGRKLVIIDLSNVRYVDWFGFEWLLEAIRSGDGEVRIGCVDPRVHAWFALNHLHRVVPMYESVDAAIAGTGPRMASCFEP